MSYYWLDKLRIPYDDIVTRDALETLGDDLPIYDSMSSGSVYPWDVEQTLEVMYG